LTIVYEANAYKKRKKTNDTKLENKKDDATYVVNASDDGMFEVQAAELAKTNASSQQVKDLASMMATDHAKANAELKATAAKKSITVPAKLGANNQKKFDKLTKLKGAEFDKEYAEMMVTAHKNAIDLFQKEADNGSDGELKAWAAGKIATLKHQSGRLPNLERQLRRDQTVGTAPDPVRPEIFAAHVTPSSFQGSSPPRQEVSNARLSRRVRGYTAFGTKMASKNMMNHYRRLLRRPTPNTLLTQALCPRPDRHATTR